MRKVLRPALPPDADVHTAAAAAAAASNLPKPIRPHLPPQHAAPSQNSQPRTPPAETLTGQEPTSGCMNADHPHPTPGTLLQAHKHTFGRPSPAAEDSTRDGRSARVEPGLSPGPSALERQDPRNTVPRHRMAAQGPGTMDEYTPAAKVGEGTRQRQSSSGNATATRVPSTIDENMPAAGRGEGIRQDASSLGGGDHAQQRARAPAGLSSACTDHEQHGSGVPAEMQNTARQAQPTSNLKSNRPLGSK